MKRKVNSLKLKFLGHIINANGIHPTNEKIKCIQKAPQNLTQLKSWIIKLPWIIKLLW